ncbi:guanine nucleotide exchange factor DBS-like isoform X3 [Physella acuta]|uniref:guanine nucleotide exchange factor DBS-like isoform X3 n=1 Tax=Physella acuta TaxID=109671 RepID=UPI0027DB39CC|nr:guanine nucleotide exchange factor DBS-like isoform X3 [Physella acuta]
MATLSSPDSDDPLGIGRKMGMHHHCPHIIISGSTNNNNNNSSSKNYQQDPLAHKHVEENIESFLETFKHKTWCVDKGGLLDRRPSSDSGDSSTGWTSSALSTTDDLSTDSPERDNDIPSGAVGHTSWNDREGIIAESRRIARWAWRQARFAGSQETPCACSYHPPHPLNRDAQDEFVVIESKDDITGSAMDETVQQYKVIDVASLLQTKYAILSGGKAKNGAPIMTFPARPGLPDVPDEDYGKVVSYLCGITPLHESEAGFVIVIDRRQDSWGAVKAILLKLSAFFPVHIQVVFLLQPKGFFQRAFADFRSKFVKEELEFKVVLCDSPKDMEDYIETAQLTLDVGGELEFDASEWTEHRSAVEKFSKNTAQISTNLSAVVKKMEERELPNDVTGTEAVMRVCMAERKELLEDIDSASAHGETLLKCIKGDNSNTPLTKLCHVLELERLLVQLDESRTGFGEFWHRHEAKLKQCLVVRRFEEEFKLVQFSMERRLETLESQTEELGNSVMHVEQLIRDFDKFEEDSQKDLDQTDRMRARGEQLMMDEHYAVDSIRPKCVELQRMCEQYKELLRKRREMLTKSHDLQDRLDRANKWCSNGVDLLAGQAVDKLQTQQGAQSALLEIEKFLRTSRELKLNNPKEFRQLFESMMTNETRATVQQILKRMEDVQGMCEKRKDSLRHFIDPRPRPVQQVNPEPHPMPGHPQRETRENQTLKPPTDHVDSNNIGHQRTASDGKKPVVSLDKSVRYRPDAPTLHPATRGVSNASDFSFTAGGMVTRSASNVSSSSTTDTHISSLSSASMSSFPDTEGLQSKRTHVMNELIETEEAYVNELNQILQGYYNKMEDRSLQMMIPPALLGQRNILFGNLQQIYNFHKDTFLHELKACHDCPSLVGKCFVNRKEEFQMYSIYCQNKPKSEALRVTVGDSNPFFKECQRQLGHRLPLGAYLLKPIQRITKYQLLLKEMLRFNGESPELVSALKEALDTMLSVLAYLNDSMHQVAIIGYGENISDLGRLLMHGSFRVWTEHKHERIRDIRLRPMQRHVFLYQRALLLCKKKDEHHGNNDQPSYTFKNKLNLSQVGLTEKIKGDKRKFELWLRGREEVYIIQAPDLQTKDVWVKEIKKVLMTQFDHLKANRKMGSQNILTDITPQLSSDSSDYSLDNWRSSDSEKHSTVPIGLEMCSPASPPYLTDRQEDEEDYEEEFDRGWSSSEFSNTDDETTPQYIPKIEPSYKEHFISLGEYSVIDPTELGLQEGDEVEVMRTGTNGWWYARHLRTNQEGWVPSTYLEPVSRGNTLYSSSGVKI